MNITNRNGVDDLVLMSVSTWGKGCEHFYQKNAHHVKYIQHVFIHATIVHFESS